MANCLHEHAEWIAPGNRILIHTLELKWQFSPYVCIGKPWICNVFCPPTTWGSWLCAHCTVTTFTRFGQNWSLGCRSACIAWVYYACIQLNSGGFWTIFFCLVYPLLVEKKISAINVCMFGGIRSTWGDNFYTGTQNGLKYEIWWQFWFTP